MKRIVLIFGVLSGVVSSALITMTTYLCTKGIIDFENGAVAGYTGIVIAFLLVFFGIRTYRENSGGFVTFGRAFKVGLLIVLISCAFYVVSWQVVYYGKFIPDFWARYSEHVVADMQKKGETPAAIEAKRKEMVEFEKAYENPLINAAYTILEPLPVGLLAALISAAILRRKPKGGEPAPAMA